MSQLSTTLLILVLILLPLAVWAEQTINETWNERLILPGLGDGPERHTLLREDGFFLPSRIRDDVVISANNSPVILTDTVTVLQGASLTIEPGTILYMSEYAQLVIEGKLIARGDEQKKIIMSSNELYENNQIWGGIVAKEGSLVKISQAVITDASPAVSCLVGSQTTIDRIQIQRTHLGVYQASDNCQIRDSVIRSIRDGIVAIGVKAQVNNLNITAKRDNIREALN